MPNRKKKFVVSAKLAARLQWKASDLTVVKKTAKEMQR